MVVDLVVQWKMDSALRYVSHMIRKYGPMKPDEKTIVSSIREVLDDIHQSVALTSQELSVPFRTFTVTDKFCNPMGAAHGGLLAIAAAHTLQMEGFVRRLTLNYQSGFRKYQIATVSIAMSPMFAPGFTSSRIPSFSSFDRRFLFLVALWNSTITGDLYETHSAE